MEGKLVVHTVGFTCKRVRGSVPIQYERHKPVNSRKEYILTTFSCESSGRIIVGVQENSIKYNLKFYPKVIYKSPLKSSYYSTVIQWYIGNSLYKVFTNLPLHTVIGMLDS